jgi:hypothetical protein
MLDSFCKKRGAFISIIRFLDKKSKSVPEFHYLDGQDADLLQNRKCKYYAILKEIFRADNGK